MAKSKYLNKSGLNYLWQKIHFGFKPKQAPVNITSTSLNFIDSISQDADGVISATKSALPQICGLTGSTGNIIYHDGSKWTVLGKPSSDAMILGSSSGNIARCSSCFVPLKCQCEEKYSFHSSFVNLDNSFCSAVGFGGFPNFLNIKMNS